MTSSEEKDFCPACAPDELREAHLAALVGSLTARVARLEAGLFRRR
jgi:hypothetical protein